MKKLTPKTHMTIANVLMGAAAVYCMIDMVLYGMQLRLVPTIIVVVLAAAGYTWRLTLVKCPHCGDRFKGIHSKLPNRCPNCNGRLDKMPEDN